MTLVLVREFRAIIDAVAEISSSTEALLTSRPTPALRELERIIDAVGEITASVAACLTTGELVPDTFPAEWCEG